jgi:hypothetical protein
MDTALRAALAAMTAGPPQLDEWVERLADEFGGWQRALDAEGLRGVVREVLVWLLPSSRRSNRSTCP